MTKWVSQSFQEVKEWATEMVIVVWATLIDEEGEVKEAQRQEQENCIFKKEAVASRIIALIETGIEDMTGASNDIITWNQDNTQA